MFIIMYVHEISLSCLKFELQKKCINTKFSLESSKNEKKYKRWHLYATYFKREILYQVIIDVRKKKTDTLQM